MLTPKQSNPPIVKRIDSIEAALLADELTDFVSTNRLGHGREYQKLANQSQDSASQQPCNPLRRMAAMRLILYDTIDISFLIY